jgi:hypothetical protein
MKAKVPISSEGGGKGRGKGGGNGEEEDGGGVEEEEKIIREQKQPNGVTVAASIPTWTVRYNLRRVMNTLHSSLLTINYYYQHACFQ